MEIDNTNMAQGIAMTDGEINFVSSFDLLGPVGEKLISPCCVSVSRTGEYAVSDPESCFIVIYNSFGEYLSHFSTIPKSTFYFLWDIDKHKPQDVAWLSSKKIVYTQPWGSKVVISNWKGNVSTCIEGKPLYQPFGVCVDNSDQIYVTDREKGRVLCYSAEGKLIKSFGGFGSNGFSLSNPHYIAITNTGEIVLNEIVKDNVFIKIFNRKSGIHKIISVDTDNEKIISAGGLALDYDDNIIHIDSKNNTLSVYTCKLLENNEYSNTKFTLNNICDMYGVSFNREGNLVCIDDKKMKIFPWATDNLHCNGHVKSSSDLSVDSN